MIPLSDTIKLQLKNVILMLKVNLIAVVIEFLLLDIIELIVVVISNLFWISKYYCHSILFRMISI